MAKWEMAKWETAVDHTRWTESTKCSINASIRTRSLKNSWSTCNTDTNHIIIIIIIISTTIRISIKVVFNVNASLITLTHWTAWLATGNYVVSIGFVQYKVANSKLVKQTLKVAVFSTLTECWVLQCSLSLSGNIQRLLQQGFYICRMLLLMPN